MNGTNLIDINIITSSIVQLSHNFRPWSVIMKLVIGFRKKMQIFLQRERFIKIALRLVASLDLELK